MTMIPTRRPITVRLVRHLALALAVAAVSMAGLFLCTGSSLGLLSASATSTASTVSSGSVSLTSVAGGTCSSNALLPGSVAAACTLTTTYAGTVPALLALDIVIETQSGNGGTNLYNPSDSTHDLQVAITSSSPTVTYVVPTVATTCPGSAPSGSTCYALSDELVSTTSFTSSSPAVTFSTVVSLPAGSTTGYRGGAAQIIETVHATQATNNGSTTTCTVGTQCDTTTPGAAAPKWN